MQEFVIHQNIERKLQCIFIGTLGMKERKEKKIFFWNKEIVIIWMKFRLYLHYFYFIFHKKIGDIIVSLIWNKLPKSKICEWFECFFEMLFEINCNIFYSYFLLNDFKIIHFSFTSTNINIFPSFHSNSPGKLKHIIHRRKINQMRYPL
jgi:hypothetical protein